MRKNHCYDDFIEMIKLASQRFGPSYQICQYSLNVFKKMCSLIDSVIQELTNDLWNIESYEIQVDEETFDILISLELDGFYLSSKKNASLIRLIQCAPKIQVHQSETKPLVNVEFLFPGVWERKKDLEL